MQASYCWRETKMLLCFVRKEGAPWKFGFQKEWIRRLLFSGGHTRIYNLRWNCPLCVEGLKIIPSELDVCCRCEESSSLYQFPHSTGRNILPIIFWVHTISTAEVTGQISDCQALCANFTAIGLLINVVHF